RNDYLAYMRKLLPILLLAGIAATASGQKTLQPIHYTVSLRDPANHCFKVTMRLATMPADSLDLFLPRWTPGYYQLMPFARQLTAFHVSAGHWTRPDSSQWRIYAPRGTAITVTYTVRAERRFVANPYLGADHAYILP